MSASPQDELLIKQTIRNQALLAMHLSLKNRRDVNALIFRLDVGVIDIKFGDAKGGLAHILNRRRIDGTLDVQTTDELLQDLAGCIAFGRKSLSVATDKTERITLASGEVGVVLSKNVGERA